MRLRRIKCEYCGRKFETTAPNAKYCSIYCKDAAQRQARTDWESRHPFYNLDYFRNTTYPKRKAR